MHEVEASLAQERNDLGEIKDTVNWAEKQPIKSLQIVYGLKYCYFGK